jgi:hypothetical protein
MWGYVNKKKVEYRCSNLSYRTRESLHLFGVQVLTLTMNRINLLIFVTKMLRVFVGQGLNPYTYFK